MNLRILILPIAFIIVLFGLCICGFAQETYNGLEKTELNYINISDYVWAQLKDDLYYSSDILEQYANKEINGQDAMVTTSSVYLLFMHTSDLINELEPPQRYLYLHSLTVSAAYNLQAYLWNLSKYYETGNNEYANAAAYYFNKLAANMKDADKERKKLKDDTLTPRSKM